jgi:flagellar hook-length control protein FliK
LNTDRLGSGPSHAGDLTMLSGLQTSRNNRLDVREKGPETFASMIERREKAEPKVEEHARAPQKPNGNNEAGSRTDKDLSVKRNSSERAESPRKKDDEETNSEPKAEMTEEKTADRGNKHSKRNLSQRQKVMQEFMDSVESEFSIPPERMVEAMAKLNDKEILKAPEETASQIISEMKLPAEVSSKVEARYVKMLTKLSDLESHAPEKFLQPAGEQLAWLQALGGMAGMGAIASVKAGANGEAPSLLSVRDQRMMLNDSLQQLNQKFFPNQLAADDMAAGQALGKPEIAGALTPTAAAGIMNEGEKTAVLNGMDANQGAIDISQLKTQLQGMNGPKLSEKGYQELAEKMATLGIAAGALNQNMKADPTNRAALKIEQALQAQAAGGGQMNPSAASFAVLAGGRAAGSQNEESLSGGKGGRDSGDMSSSPGGKSDLAVNNGEFMVQQQQQDAPLLNKAGLASAAAAGVSVTRSADPSQNIQQLMNQAQYVMKKGGGEAIVKLNPEGLGEVHMKVIVSEGKVSVQMSAQTKEAKDLIESSMNDLKASLGVHNLKIDHLKVDVGNHASGDANSQQQQAGGFKFDQGREQARQFLNNFQEDNTSNRGGYFESPGLRGYTTKGPEPLKPSTGVSAQSRRYVGEGRGTGLNLVA